MVWHVLRKEDTDWVKKCMEWKWRAPDQEVDHRGHWKRLCKDCQARNLNREHAMEMEEADKDWMMIRMVGG